ncbi:MAG: iron ABC transporter permease [Bacteroidaceae bacterium]|nr:iron ABC transporter permease [Bacteroidaceae bacterium]
MRRILPYLLALFTVVLFITNLLYGSVHIPMGEVINILFGGEPEKASWGYIILESRLPQALTALLSGAALAAAGLMLQTAFNNPLAGPDVLGINAGAGLGAAIVLLLFGGLVPTGNLYLGGSLALVGAAFIGALFVTLIIIFFAARLRSHAMLLIIGMMIGYIVSSAVSLLNFFSTAEGVQSYLMWGMGNFGGVSRNSIPLFATLILIGIGIAISLIKPLNALLLGERYAENLGINIRNTRLLLLLSTGLLVAVTTAYCGPISFIGLAVPHMARLLLGTGNHRSLMPTTILCGSLIALLCNLISTLPGDNGLLPLNAITPIIGAPIIIYVIVSRRKGLS